MRRRGTRPPGSWRRFLSAMAVAAVAVAGVPAALVAAAVVTLGAAHPLPAVGSRREIADYFQRGLSATEIVPIAARVLLAVGWLLWLALVASVAGGVVEARSGAPGRWLPLRPFAGLSRWIAAGLTTFSVLSSNFVSAGALSSPLPFVISAAPVTAAAFGEPPAPAVPPGYARVGPGESAETFAARVLGDPARWSELWALNRGQPVGPAGETWDVAWKLGAGWDLRLPPHHAGLGVVGADRPAPLPPEPDGPGDGGPGPARVVVEPGDSYWAIAQRSLGDASAAAVAARTTALMADNAPRLGYADPAMIHPGDVVYVAETSEAAATPAPPGDGAADDGASTDAAADGAHTYVVVPGDSYWRIAERRAVALHGADRAYASVVYRLMLDLIDLNAPRLGHADREMLWPGDVVWLYDPALVDTGPSPQERRAAAAVVVEAVGTAVDRAGALAEEVADLAAHAGAAAAPAAATAPVAAPPSTGDAPVTSLPVPPGHPAPGGDASAERAPAPIGVTEAALMATGLAAVLAARRRARLRRAEPPARVPLRPTGVATERALRQVGDDERLLRVDIALRAAAASLATGASRVAAVRSAPDGTIELVLTAPATPPPPWTVRADRWRLPALVTVEELAAPARTVGLPCVALAELGVDDEGWDVLVDLEALGVTAIDADAATADAVVRALAAGLASSVFAEVAHLIGVGVDEAALLDHRHAHVVDTVDEALELAATLVGPEGSPVASTFALRARHTGGESWEPAVILVAAARAAELTEALAAAVSGRRGVAAVVAGPLDEADWVVRAGAPLWRLEPAGLGIRPVGLSADGAAELAALAGGDGEPLLAVAETPRDAPDPAEAAVPSASTASAEPDPLVGAPFAVGVTPGSNGHGARELDWSLMVRLLGPVELVDRALAPASVERAKSLELLAWMVTHRERATRAAARTALWDLDVRDATFANVVSEARRTAARHAPPPAGDEWLRRTMTDELSLHPAVVADADVVRAALAAARGSPVPVALDVLRPAVELVRGMPFAGTGYLWPDAEGITSTLVMLVTAVTTEYARLALEAGDGDGVFWATGVGLGVIAGQEGLIALRMEAHARSGDRSGVRVEWEAYERVITADPWSDGEPSPRLVALRQRLLAVG